MGRKLLLVLTVIALTFALGASSAYADQVLLGDSCVSNGGTDTLNFAVPVTGEATMCNAAWEQGANFAAVGLWSLTNSGVDFSLWGTQTGYTTWGLDGTVANWVNDFSCGYALCGQLTVTSVSGFNDEYSVGGVYAIHLGGTSLGGVSSGEIPVPEPGSLMLFGTGLLGMAGFLRRKIGL